MSPEIPRSHASPIGHSRDAAPPAPAHIVPGAGPRPTRGAGPPAAEVVGDRPDSPRLAQGVAGTPRSRSSISHAWSMTWWAVRRTRNPMGHVRADLPSAL
jgi:hypothetical protein